MTRFITIAALLALVLGLGTPPPADAQSPQPLNAVNGRTMQNAATALGNGSLLDTSNASTAVFQASFTGTATVTYEGTVGGSLFNSLTCFTLDGQTSASTTTTSNILRCNVLGIIAVRARISAFSSGTVTIVGNASAAGLPNIRDSTSPSGAITGQLRGTQTTAPTCAKTLPGTGGGVCSVTGTDSFMRVLIGFPWSTSTGGGASATVTFNTAYGASPSCVATWDGTDTYRYYIYAVTASATTAILKLGGANGVAPNANFSPGDNVNLICTGVQ